MNKARLAYLINALHSDSLTVAEQEELQSVLQQKDHPDLQELLDELARSGVPAAKQNQHRADQIFSHITSTETFPAAIPIKRKFQYWWYAAAAVFVLAIATVLNLQQEKPFPEKAVKSQVLLSADQRRYVFLPDSSKVILNQGASLSYGNFGNNREVTLTGEAFFDIRHDPEHPFIVYTGSVKTTVLGTAFNISATKGKPITITVTRGKVRVEDKNRPVALLIPNQQVTIDTSIGKAKNLVVDAAQVTRWNRQELVFDDILLGEVALAIETKFDIPVVFADAALKDNRITAAFTRNESLEQVLEVITKINGMHYSINEKEVVLGTK